MAITWDIEKCPRCGKRYEVKNKPHAVKTCAYLVAYHLQNAHHDQRLSQLWFKKGREARV